MGVQSVFLYMSNNYTSICYLSVQYTIVCVWVFSTLACGGSCIHMYMYVTQA